ncbi:ImmA/IrrE family metallo-endopeptidase [Macrococcus armenti]|uniref:ImmA/IrrE family metallo-endopeptidase n=1 Tax=Macrococcus armenti TaxID=2875764 RepID=UPI001CD4DACC|nr:ImmA/IrrE family metallo-endopeptidase [Macrococcus armenti]UBH10638.1 ImmA/IrrE family metallo-endopeptidase [Macrococcus armenti]
MIVKEIYHSHGIKCIEDLNIDNVASAFNISLFKNYPLDVRIQSNDVDIIMLQAKDIYTMTEAFFHEFAHVLRHGHTHISDSYRKYCEGQANKLMYELAIPDFMINEELLDYKDLSTRFNVTEEFALKRIDQLKINRFGNSA